MGKFKVNQEVFSKSKREKGIIKNVDVVRHMKDGKVNKVEVEYMVCFNNEPMHNWVICQKSDLSPIPKEKKEPTTSEEVILRRGNVLIGAFLMKGKPKHVLIPPFNELYNVSRCEESKYWSVGLTYCHPDDEFDMDFAVKLAKHRAKNTPYNLFTGKFTPQEILKVMGEWPIPEEYVDVDIRIDNELAKIMREIMRQYNKKAYFTDLFS